MNIFSNTRHVRKTAIFLFALFLGMILLQGCTFGKSDMEVATKKVEKLFDGDIDQFFKLDQHAELKSSVDQAQIEDALEAVEKLDVENEDELELLILFTAVHFAEIELAKREDGDVTESHEPKEELEVYVPEESDITFEAGTLTNQEALEAFVKTAGENGDDNESSIRIVKDEGENGVILYDLQSRYDENADQRWIDVHPYLDYFNTASLQTQEVFNSAPQQCGSMSKEYDFYMMNECRTHWEFPLIPVVDDGVKNEL